jgi:hypothetical protein
MLYSYVKTHFLNSYYSHGNVVLSCKKKSAVFFKSTGFYEVIWLSVGFNVVNFWRGHCLRGILSVFRKTERPLFLQPKPQQNFQKSGNGRHLKYLFKSTAFFVIHSKGSQEEI